MNKNYLSLIAAILLVFISFAEVNGQCGCTNCPQALPDNGQQDFFVNVQDSNDDGDATDDCMETLTGVTMMFDHQYIGDLEITVTSPCGNTITLVGPIGFFGATDNSTWDITFVDGVPAPDAGQSGVFTNNDGWGTNGTFTGTYNPSSGTLAALNCPNNCGAWTFSVNDDQFLDVGNFIDFGLEFADPDADNATAIGCDSNPPANCDSSPMFTVGDVCSGQAINWASGPGCSGLDWDGVVAPGSGTVVDLLLYAPGGNPGMAPAGFTLDLQAPTHTPGFSASVATLITTRNPDIEIEDFDFTCDDNSNSGNPTHPGFINNTCAPITVTFFTVVFDRDLDTNADLNFEYDPSCTVERHDITIYPTTLTVTEATDGSDCGTPLAELRAANGDLCSSQSGVGVGAAATGSCSENSDALMYDFTADPIITALAAAPAACTPANLTGTIQCEGCSCEAVYDYATAPSVCSGQASTFTIEPGCVAPGPDGTFPEYLDIDWYIYIDPGTGLPGTAPAGYDPITVAGGVNPNYPITGTDLSAPGAADGTGGSWNGTICDDLTLTYSITNNTCAPFTVSYFALPWDRRFDTDGDGDSGEYNNVDGGTCNTLRWDVIVYPAPLQVVQVTNGSNCGTPLVELRDAAGNACSTQSGVGIGAAATGSCTQDSESLMYDFTTDPIVTALAGAPAACLPANLTGTIQCMDCFTCPEITNLASATPICDDETFDLTATVSGMDEMNGGGPYGIDFVYFTAAVADPYTGGTSLGTVANGGLTGAGTTATDLANSLGAGTYVIYAILSPAPAAPYDACRPSADFTLVVNAVPTADAVADDTYCNTDAGAAIAFTSTTAGTTFNWTGTTDVGFGTAGAGDIAAYTATNATAAPITTTVTVTPTANGCVGADITFDITVNPTPVADAVANLTHCHQDAAAAIPFTSATAGTTYAWTSTTDVGFGTAGTGDIAAYTATNPGVNPITTTVSVTPTANGCVGPVMTFDVTVNPFTYSNIVGCFTVCSSQAGVGYSIDDAGPGAVYNWVVAGGAIASGVGTNAITVDWGAGPASVTLSITGDNQFGCDIIVPNETVTILAPIAITADYVCINPATGMVDLDTYYVTVSTTGGSGTYTVTDNQGSAAQAGVAAGTTVFFGPFDWTAVTSVMVSVNDGNSASPTGCIDCTDSATVIAPDLDIVMSSTPPKCPDSSNGTATATATGGVAPYTYLWSDGQTTETAIDLPVGTYGVTVTDVDGCITADGVTLVPACEECEYEELTLCGESWFDDGGVVNPYDEYNAPCAVQYTICPDMPSMQRVKLQFNLFDVAPGDMLLAYDGCEVLNSTLIEIAAPNGTGTGPSVADAPGGGWVQASCENDCGCITLVFMRNGDGTKGAGWDVDVTCEDRDVAFTCELAPSYYAIADCGASVDETPDGGFNTPFYSEVIFPLPTFDICGEAGGVLIESDCYLEIETFDTDGILVNCGDGSWIIVGGTFAEVEIPVGQHDVCFTAVAADYVCGTANQYEDKSCCTNVYITQPPLVCNDELNISVDQACSVVFTPDMILEDECLDAPSNGVIYIVELSTASIENVFATLPSLIGTTDEGYPIYDFSDVECGTYFDLSVTRRIPNRCGGPDIGDSEPTYLEDKCWGRVLVSDNVTPVLVGNTEVVSVPCYAEDKFLGGAPLDVALNALVSDPYDIFTVVDNCSNSLLVGAWTEEVVDCTDGGFGGLDPDGNGIADDVLWDIMAVEMGPAAIFKCYFRVIQAIDGCGAVSSNFAYQGVCVIQPDIVFPQIEIEVACGTNIDPVAIYDLWASDPDWFQNMATWIPNYDPTPLEVNIGDLDYGNLEDTYFTNVSGDETPADPSHTSCGYAIDWVDGNAIEVCAGGGAYKLFRDWTVYNWCDGHLELIDIIPQVIKVGDSDGPIINTNGIDWYQSGSPLYTCAGDLVIEIPEIIDACSGSVQIFASVFEVEIDATGTPVLVGQTPEIESTSNGTITVPNVPIGLIQINLRAIDACGNESTYTDGIELFFDDIAPVAICESAQTISLGSGDSYLSQYQGFGTLDSDCAVLVPAAVFDDGSYDNCGAIQFSVARMDSDSDGDGFPEDDDFGDYVVFTVDDLADGCEGTTRVVFRVNDLSAYDINRDGVIDGDDNVDITGLNDIENTIDDDGANYNYCMVDVTVQDKIPPVASGFNSRFKCNDPAIDDLIQASLSDDPTGAILDFALGQVGFVESFVTDNCEQILGGNVLSADFSGFDATCRNGVVTYTLQWYDNCGNPSNIVTGTYVVDPCSDWKMTFPLDAEVYCEDGAGLPAASSLDDILTNDGCDFWGLEVNESTFEAVEGACYKVVREYHLINWCTWSPSNTEVAVVERPDDLIGAGQQVSLRYRDASTSNADGCADCVDDGPDGINDIDDGNEDHDFTGAYDGSCGTPVYLYDSNGNIADADEAANCDIYDVTALCFDGDFVVIDYADFAYQNIPTYAAVSQFSGVEEHYVSAQQYGNILYRQILKVNDGVAPSLAVVDAGPFCGGETADCSAEVAFSFSVTDPCSANYNVSHSLRPFGGGAITDVFGTLEATAEGAYTIGGTYPIGVHSFTVTVADGCGNTEIQEFEFEVKDCKAPTAYCIFGLSADLMPTGMVELWASDFDAGSSDLCSDVTLTFADPTLYPDSINRVFECAKGEIGTVEVTIWAQDAAGNTSYCTTFVNVQANQADTDCPNASGAMIAGQVETEAGEMVQSVEVSLSGNASSQAMTSNDGRYTFAGLETDYDYSVTPVRDDQPLNGVSTFDLVLISKHVLGIDLLDSPYKLIAADVNNSGSITTFDMVQLRKLILNIETDFPNNTSWRFVAQDYVFANPANPFAEQYPELMNFNNLAESHLSANFIGIKVGDVNGSATANAAIGTEGRGANGSFGLKVENNVIKAGETTTVNFTADLSAMAGYQFTLDFTGLELVNIVEGAATAANFGIFDGQLTASWNDNATGIEAFGLTFTATEDIVLSEALSLNSSRTAAEAYTKAGELQDVVLNFATAGFELYQNTPNPFDTQTTVSFSLPQAGNATLTVTDVTGKVLQVIDATYAEGYNQIVLDAKTLAPGVLSYTLATKEFTATKKMIILE